MSLNLDSRGIPSEDKKDIVELQKNIENFHQGKYDEERFKLYRLTRGVYGQRQLGVQMFRIKVPYGSITPQQIRVVADLSDQYASSNLHLTTRQDIQLHYVKLDDSPAVWAGLTEAGLTGREACGNTVRNLTTSSIAGVDPEEAFDPTPYAHATAYYFLRNPISQEMGRKIKPAFSSSEKDTAFTYFADFGFIPRIQNENGEEKKGFKVVVGGGLGAQAIVAQTAYEFLAADQIIPFMEAAIRVFDRHGEREKRHKARMKFLLKKIGVDGFLALVAEERKSIPHKSVPIDDANFRLSQPVEFFEPQITTPKNQTKFEQWKRTNVFEQKQKDFYGVFVKVFLGDLKSDKARQFADVAQKYASQDIRITINQGFLFRFVRPEHLVELFEALDKIGLAEPGFDSIVDITACPGTDTCNLAVTNSTGLAGKLEDYIKENYAELIEDSHIKIKISGCMNACGQHMAANIGFHGSSIKKNGMVIPAMQIVLAGGLGPDGKGWIAEKVIKLPTKRIPKAVGVLLDDFAEFGAEDQYYNDYFLAQGKRYFYDLLKPLANVEGISETEFLDWGQDHQYKQEIGVGECAGVILDVVGTIIKDGQEKLEKAQEALALNSYSEGIYYAYTSFVVGAKALLLSEDIKCNTQIGILQDFQEKIIDEGKFEFTEDFKTHVLQINKNEPTEDFAEKYISNAASFLENILEKREEKLKNDGDDKEVVNSYYKA